VASGSPYDSEFFPRFIVGLENRLGQRTRQDASISIEVMMELITGFEEDYVSLPVGSDEQGSDKQGPDEQRRCVEGACIALYSFARP
jgi:hypothetical protein